jgi:dipeptidyl aminopeptidase/acylaminoacyl peptidase
MGTSTVSSTDGGDQEMVLAAPSDLLERPDFVLVSPDGSQLLVNRQEKGKGGEVFIYEDNESGATFFHLMPEGVISCEFPNGDFLERGGIEESWSPDGKSVTFCGFVLADGFSSLYVSGPAGKSQIVGTDIGAVSAQWSPDGDWIAFTSKLARDPQVWVVRPDGGDRRQLTTGADGSTSVGAIWSPDGSRLLFQRKSAGVVTLWTMNADGSNQRPLTSEPIGPDYMGPYAWWPAPAGAR